MSTGWAIETTLRLTAFSLLIQATEMLSIRRSWGDRGAWSWRNLRGEFRVFGSSIFSILDVLLSARGYFIVLLIQCSGAIICVIWPDLRWAPLFFVAALMSCLRWRGTFNGGSDYMTIVVLMALTVAAVLNTPRTSQLALYYVGIQVLASYFIAGLVKLKEPEWRTGIALQTFLKSSVSAQDSWVLFVLRSRALIKTASWAVIVFELLSPFILLFRGHPQFWILWLSSALGFHLLNSLIFGLNRFFWAWLAGYCGVALLCV